MKRTTFGIAALFLLSATPCVVNAFTAIAWSQSGQKDGWVKNAPTKEVAISAAIADCKKSGGGSDCQVFKVTDEPGFVALYATCAKTCGVTAVTGRPTAEQARADGKRECEAYYRASCQLAQEWQEGQPPLLPAPSPEVTTQCFVKDDPCACLSQSEKDNVVVKINGKGEEITYENDLKQRSAIEIICAVSFQKKLFGINNNSLMNATFEAINKRQDVAMEAVKYNVLSQDEYEKVRKENYWGVIKPVPITPEQGSNQNADVVENARACESGNGVGCYNLGLFYSKGKGVPQDKQKAAKYYDKACDFREESGCTNLGVLYSKGEGVRQDKQKAVQYYDKGCGLGDGNGCYNLGNVYRKGNDVRQDKQQAFQYYDKACSLKHGFGCLALGYMYDDGSGGRQDKQKAAYFLKKACELNVDEACSH